MSVLLLAKQEILDTKIAGTKTKRAFLSGAIRGAGSLGIEEGGLALILQHPSKAFVEKCADLVRSLTSHIPTVYKKVKDRSLGSKTVYELQLAGAQCKKLLMDTGITNAPSQIADAVPPYQDDSEKRAYVRGLFAASGAITIPKDNEPSGYLLEIALSSQTVAEGVTLFLQAVDIHPKFRIKKNTGSLYLKDSDQIGDFLAYIGANNAYFKLLDIVLYRNAKNMANRHVNCDIANINRGRQAADRQLFAIRLIDEKMGIQNLPPPLCETAACRLENPDASVAELLLLLPNPPTKSGLNHRLRRLIELAETL